MVMEENNIADGTVETPSLEELQDRLKKAEAKIVEMKTSNKTEETKDDVKSDEVDLDEKINKLLESKLSSLLEKKEEDKYDINQEKTNSMSLGGEDNISSSGFKGMSLSEYDKLTQSQKKDYIRASNNEMGEVIFL